MNIEELCTSAEQTANAWNNLYSSSTWEDFPEDSLDPYLRLPLPELNQVVLDTLALVGSLGKTKKFIDGMENLLFKAHPGVIRMVENLTAFRKTCVTIKGNLDHIAANEDLEIKEIDANGVLSLTNNTGFKDFGTHLKSLFPAIQNILQGLSDLLPIARTSGRAELSVATKAHQDMASKMRGTLEELQATSAELAEKIERAETTLAAAEKTAEEITTTKTEAAADRDGIHKLSIDAKAYLEQIENTLTEAKNLETQITASREDLTAFDAELDNRLKLFDSFKEKTSQAATENAERETAIDALIKQAEDMLKGATVAGLASAFQKSSNIYGKEADQARGSFKWAILFLFLSTLPLVLYAIPLDLSQFMPNGKPAVPSSTTITMTLGGILSRVLFLFPATWYASFVFRRYNKLFDLHKAYQFKANIAMSVEGFRKQAEEYEQEIAASAFLDLTTPPDSPQYEHSHDGNPNRFTSAILRRVERWSDRMGDYAKDKKAAEKTAQKEE